MAETDLSDWLVAMEAAMRIGCSTRTIERLGAAKKIEARLRPRAGSPPVAVYNPEDVARIAAERQPAPPAFVLPAVTAGNGNGTSHTSDMSNPHTRSVLARRPAADDAQQQFFAYLLHTLQSPPSPPVSESVAETRMFVTLKEAAAISGLPAADLKRACESRELKARRTGRGGWRIHRAILEAFR
jgi:hypothetical protein